MNQIQFFFAACFFVVISLMGIVVWLGVLWLFLKTQIESLKTRDYPLVFFSWLLFLAFCGMGVAGMEGMKELISVLSK